MTINKHSEITRERVFSNLIWKFSERCGAQVVTFIVSIILARVLEPEIYGTVALITVFTEILQVFVDSGLGNALIQKKEVDEMDFSTVFFTNLFLSLFLYSAIFLCAPLIASFYNDSLLEPLIRVLSLTVVVSGIKNVQQAYVSRNMMFKSFFYATFWGTLIAALIGIYLAMNGFGVWALVIQQVLKVVIDTTILWITVKWKPRKVFSFARLSGLFSFGWKLLVASLINSIYSNIRQLIIGKIYPSADLAFYNRGMQFPSVIVSNVNSSIDSVLLPAMSSAQDDKEQVKKLMRRSIKMSTYIMAPLMMGLAFTAPAIVGIVLTDKWLPCVPFLRIFCITYMFYPIHTANLNAINAMGHSEIFLKLEIIKKIIGIILLFSTMWFGIMAMTYSLLVSSLLSQIINAWPNQKILGYKYTEQLKDILPSILLALFMGVCVSLFKLTNWPMTLTLMVQIFCGAIIYIMGSMILKIDSFDYLLGIGKPMLNKYLRIKNKK